MISVHIGEQMEFGLIIVLDVATSLRMSARAMLLRTGSQSVLVHHTSPVMVIMVLSSCTSTLTRQYWYVQSSSILKPSNQPHNSRGPRLMYEESLHLLPMLYQLACEPNCYEFRYCSCFPKMGFVGERAIKCDAKIRRPVVVFHPFPV